MSRKPVVLESFKVINAISGEVAFISGNVIHTAPLDQFLSCYRLPFSKLNKNGRYKIIAGEAVSPEFAINENVYDGTADFLLNYMRQQEAAITRMSKIHVILTTDMRFMANHLILRT